MVISACAAHDVMLVIAIPPDMFYAKFAAPGINQVRLTGFFNIAENLGQIAFLGVLHLSLIHI